MHIKWHKEKSYLIIFLIVICGIGITFGLTYKKAQLIVPVNETAHWNTYTNSKYGFSFQYPKDWTVELADPSRDLFFISSPQTKQTIDNANQQNLAHTGADISLHLENQELNLENQQNFFKAFTKINLGNKDWYRYQYKPETGDANSINYASYVPEQKSLWVFSFDSNSSVVSEKQLKSIISTFQFEKKNLYTNTAYGYEFTVPPSSEQLDQQNSGGDSFSQLTNNIYLGDGANITVNTHPAGKSSEYTKENFNTYRNFKKITLNGYDAWQEQGSGTAGAWFITTLIFGDKYVYEIQYSKDGPNVRDQKYIDTQNKMVASFKLL